ncbi:MAG TPA: YhjD/YihY/BrkB family envelope integrity protein [Acidimicrobiales bacterium]
MAPRALERLDDLQQRTRIAPLFGVVKKFGDDRGGSLAALITYYGFLSLFPLLLLFYTVVAFVLPHYPGAQADLTKSVISQFPVIGPQLQQNTQHPLKGSGLALIVGVVALVWGSLGVAQILQFTMQEVWNIPGRDRPGYVTRLLRSLLLFLVLGLGIATTTAVSGLGTILDWGPAGSLLAALPALVVNIGLFLLVFRLLTSSEVSLRQLVPGAVLGGIGWQVLQTVGVNLVSHQLQHASQVYGVFGFTLALISFLALAATLTVYSAELNVVLAHHLWPRSLLQPSPAA